MMRVQGCAYLQQALDSDLGMRMTDAICRTLESGAQKVCGNLPVACLHYSYPKVLKLMLCAV